MANIKAEDYCCAKHFSDHKKRVRMPGDSVDDINDSSILMAYEKKGLIVKKADFKSTPEGVAMESIKKTQAKTKKSS